MVVTKPFSGGSPPGKGQQEAAPNKGGEGPQQGAGRGHRKQLMVTMAGKKVNTVHCRFQWQGRMQETPKPLQFNWNKWKNHTKAIPHLSVSTQFKISIHQHKYKYKIQNTDDNNKMFIYIRAMVDALMALWENILPESELLQLRLQSVHLLLSRFFTSLLQKVYWMFSNLRFPVFNLDIIQCTHFLTNLYTHGVVNQIKQPREQLCEPQQRFELNACVLTVTVLKHK